MVKLNDKQIEQVYEYFNNECTIDIIEIKNEKILIHGSSDDIEDFEKFLKEGFNINLDNFIESEKIDYTAYSEQIIACDCGANHWHNDYGLQSVFIGDGVVYCADCIDWDDVLNDYINNYNNALTIDFDIDSEYLKNEKWHLINNYDFSSWHAGYSTPEQIINDLFNKLKYEYDFFFECTNIQQFGLSANLYLRKK